MVPRDTEMLAQPPPPGGERGSADTLPAVLIPFDPAAVPEPLLRIASPEILRRWASVDRSAQAPTIVATSDWRGAALVTARPGTAYLKIVDAVGVGGADAVLALARERGLAQVKWEGWSVEEPAGFTRMQAPPGAEVAGYVQWLNGAPAEEPPYYRQTENFTCGAVVALTAQVHAGAAASLDRAAELRLWRDATNFNACEPVGLGVAIRRAWPSSPVTVALDVERPVLIGYYPEPDQEWRAMLQRASRVDAAEIGVPICPERFSVAAIRDAIDAGEQVLLLISMAAMLGFEVPHWVLCHGVVAGAVVLEDPWVQAAAGETWVDSHLLAVPDAALDSMSSMEDEGYRGAVRIGRPLV
jgi:hypothetical protein